MIGSARGVWIVSEGLNKYTKYYIFLGAIFNFVFNFIFIQKWGIVGASITTLLSQLLVVFIAPLCFKKTRVFVCGFILSHLNYFPELFSRVRKRISNE